MLPIIAKDMNVAQTVFGGWLSGHILNFKNRPQTEAVVMFPHDVQVDGAVEGIKYYSFGKTDRQQRFEFIIENERPDVVHIFGTENAHSLDAINACIAKNVIDRTLVSIQGLISVYARHFFAALDPKLYKRKTLRDIIKRSSLKKNRDAFARSGKREIEVLKKCKNVIGRTDWDKACVQRINPEAKYYFCNESLRSGFYEAEWSLDRCEKHSIFVSQCSYPIKGFHLMLEAMCDIVKKYPDAHLYTTGSNLLRSDSKFNHQKMTYYNYYIKSLIDKYGLKDKVTFLGTLNEEEMKQRYLSSHVFVLPSSVENSPNSLGEAMLLGVPCVASDVGGVKNMMTHNEEGYVYPYDEPYMAAYYISEIFDNDTLAQKFSEKAKAHASHTHNVQINLEKAMEIYEKVGRN